MNDRDVRLTEPEEVASRGRPVLLGRMPGAAVAPGWLSLHEALAHKRLPVVALERLSARVSEPFVPNWWAASVGATFSDGSSVVNRAAERPSPTRPPFPPMLRKTSGGGVCFERLALTTEP